MAGIEKRIVLIDGGEPAHLMFEHNVGVADAAPPYMLKRVLKRVDIEFFEEA